MSFGSSLKFERHFERRGPLYLPRYDRVDRYERYRRRFRAAPAFVNSANGSTNASATSIATGSSISVSAGNLLIVGTGAESNSGVTPSISDTAGNTFTFIGTQDSPNSGGSTTTVCLFWCANCLGNASNSFTASGFNAVNYPSIVVLQYSGANSKDALGSAAGYATGTGTYPFGGDSYATLTTTVASTVIVVFSVASVAVNSWSADSPATYRDQSSSGGIQIIGAGDYIVSGIQTGVQMSMHMPNFTDSASIAAAFYQSGGSTYTKTFNGSMASFS